MIALHDSHTSNVSSRLLTLAMVPDLPTQCSLLIAKKYKHHPSLYYSQYACTTGSDHKLEVGKCL